MCVTRSLTIVSIQGLAPWQKIPKECNMARETNDGREKALDATMAQLRKRYGDGAIMKLGEASDMTVEAIPTGSIALDLALGIGGVPRGRITEIYGPESSGKTTICQHIIAEAQ